MDEIGIPVFDDITYEPKDTHLGSLNDHNTKTIGNEQSSGISIGHTSPYENVHTNRTVYNSLKPKSPNTNSPRTRIKTTFAHKNIQPPQFFIFPTPEKKPIFNDQDSKVSQDLETRRSEVKGKETEKIGIEKQLSLEEDIPMIDDSELTNDIEFRYSKIIKNDAANENVTNQSFDDVKKELMADIPELEAFEKDLSHKRDKIIKNITDDIKNIDIEVDNSVLDVNIDDLKDRYERLKNERRKLVTTIHEVKCKMTEITSQEDDILREVRLENIDA